jgi:glycosyltransferase involved in cell wall biosynthesis
MRKPDISIILPCYNESFNIPVIVKRISELFSEISFELILVNNGSTDDTARVLEEMKKDYDSLRVISVERNLGYGHGVMSGLKASRADILAYSHADLQAPPEDIMKAYRLLNEKKYDPAAVLIKGLRVNRRKEEQFLTKGLEKVSRILLGYDMRDINGQPKLFHRVLLEKMADYPRDFSFDVYLMYRAFQNGLKIITFPVSFGLRLHGESKWSSSFFKKYKTVLVYLKNILLISVHNINDNNNPIRGFTRFTPIGFFFTGAIIFLLQSIFFGQYPFGS